MKTILVRFIGGALVAVSIACLALSSRAQTSPANSKEVPAAAAPVEGGSLVAPRCDADSTGSRQARSQPTSSTVCPQCGYSAQPVLRQGYAGQQIAVVYVNAGNAISWAPAYYGAVCAPRSIDMFGEIRVNPIPYPPAYCAPSVPARALRHFHPNHGR